MRQTTLSAFKAYLKGWFYLLLESVSTLGLCGCLGMPSGFLPLRALALQMALSYHMKRVASWLPCFLGHIVYLFWTIPSGTMSSTPPQAPFLSPRRWGKYALLIYRVAAKAATWPVLIQAGCTVQSSSRRLCS